MHHRSQRTVTPQERTMRDEQRRSAAATDRGRNFEIWAIFVVWLLVFGAVASWRYGTPVIAATAATIGACVAFLTIRLLHRFR